MFGGVVLALAQIQRLGGHPALQRVVQPVLTGVAVAATVLKLLLMSASAAGRESAAGANVDADAAVRPALFAPEPMYLSNYVIAIIQVFGDVLGSLLGSPQSCTVCCSLYCLLNSYAPHFAPLLPLFSAHWCKLHGAGNAGLAGWRVVRCRRWAAHLRAATCVSIKE